MANLEQLEIIRRGSSAWNEWRKQNPKDNIDLNNAALSTFPSMTDLKGANLRRANLIKVNLQRANLSRAKLSGADLRGANLWGVRLTQANLSEANLTGTDLTLSRLIDTNFTGAKCADTNFTGATLLNIIFGDVDLSSARGLESVRHFGPSVIGIDTLYRSKGRIPEVFLRGVGIPQDFIDYIDYIPSFISQPLQFYSCFISYSHADKAFARRLHDGLQERGIRCWLDEKQLLPGHNIYDEVDRGIRLWDKVLLCCSQHSLTSWWVDNEINTAFAKEQQLQKERGKKALALIPLDLDGYLFQGWNDGKAQQVRARLAADFKGWEHDNAKFEEQFERIVKALQTDEGREAAPTPRL